MPALAFSPIWPLGKLTSTTPGTPVPLLNQTTYASLLPTAGNWPARVSRIYGEALNANTGLVFIGVKGMNKTTMAGVILTLPAPNGAAVVSAFDWEEAGLGSNNYRLSDYYFDVSVSGEGLILSVWKF